MQNIINVPRISEKEYEFWQSAFRILLSYRIPNEARSMILADNYDMIAAVLKLKPTEEITEMMITYADPGGRGYDDVICFVGCCQDKANNNEQREIITSFDMSTFGELLKPDERTLIDMIQFIDTAMYANKWRVRKHFWDELNNYDKQIYEQNYAATTSRDHWTVGWKRRIIQTSFDKNDVYISFSVFGNANMADNNDIELYMGQESFSRNIIMGNLETPEPIDYFRLFFYYFWNVHMNDEDYRKQQGPVHNPMEDFYWLHRKNLFLKG